MRSLRAAERTGTAAAPPSLGRSVLPTPATPAMLASEFERSNRDSGGPSFANVLVLCHSRGEIPSDTHRERLGPAQLRKTVQPSGRLRVADHGRTQRET